ncbi:Zinc finger BED domain-containing protein RICESLEEPER 2 [Euphorbia peplus]|nr:Zinc finger BED domain-containing protein RICESLEEPER 2 [Euphorbia peplus]
MRFMEFSFGNVYSNVDALKHMNEVKDNLYCLFGENLTSHREKLMENKSQSESQSQSSNLGLGKDKSRGMAQFDSMMKSVDAIPNEKSELDVYLEEKCIIHNNEIDPSFDASIWWKDHSMKFSILSKMACDILSIPITIVASESTFSAGGRVIKPHRASLGTDTVEMLMCGGDWIRALYSLKNTLPIN